MLIIEKCNINKMRLPAYFYEKIKKMIADIKDEGIITSNSIPELNRTGFDTFIVILPSFFYVFFMVFLETYLQTEKFNLFILESTFLIFPLILGMTLLSDHPNFVLFTLISSSVLFLFYIWKKNNSPIKKISFDTNFITNTRSTINILSVIAILAVDFPIFPSRFAKMDTLGYSLMDTGVGLYVFSNGIVSPESRGLNNPVTKSVRGSLPLFLIGSARFVLTELFHYHVPVSEYGRHWNFFITLGVTKLVTSLLLNMFSIENLYINGTLLLLLDQILLSGGLEKFVFDDFERDNFFKANKEGIVSSFGFIILYLYSVYFGFILDMKNKNQNFFKLLKKFLIASLICLVFSVCFQQIFGISRRIANAAYVLWILFLGIFMTGLFYCLQGIQKVMFVHKNTIFVPYIYEAVNNNGLVFFLVANVLTGVINMTIRTSDVEQYTALTIVVAYMAVNCSIVALMQSRGLRLKF
ncbi:uncharacterized protein LOC130452829 isoform X1 [Diorhabda sublineata]|uniref:uncharacterized protein LOC130452829 isoform X1 n=2 Tax=Diorhabda sublineata TaxID=1163346 RepID=UPI0024E0E798|nr:uncharacterized protein LOC130452829 isoform X1 [Diorhabda sublineata]